jgi:hypothetical protein
MQGLWSHLMENLPIRSKTQYNLRYIEISGELGVQHTPRQPLTNRSPLEALRKSVKTHPNGDEHQPDNLSNISLRQDDFRHSTPFTATDVSDTIRQTSPFHTQERSFLKANFNLRSKLNCSGESESVVSPSIFS